MERLSNLLINPVLNKEIKLRFRSFRSVLGVFFYLFVLGAIALGFIYMSTKFGTGYFRAEESRTLFMVLSMGQLGLIIFMTPGLTAGVISGEREKQTLPILLTTAQSSLTIIVSKLLSSLAYLIVMVIASLPLYSIVFLYGGVSPKMLSITFLIYFMTMLTIGSIGIMISTIIRKTMVATITTYGISLVLVVGVGLIYIFYRGVFMYNHTTGVPNDTMIPYLLLMVNPPVVLLSTFIPEVQYEIFRDSVITAPLLTGFILSYVVLSIFTIFVAVRKLRPNMKKGRKA